MVAARCADGVRETIRPEVKSNAAVACLSWKVSDTCSCLQASTNTAFWHLYDKEGCTLQVWGCLVRMCLPMPGSSDRCSAWQVMQPQRWIDGLWRLTAALEAQLGCLVGVNAYLTPAGGLQPGRAGLITAWLHNGPESKRDQQVVPGLASLWQGYRHLEVQP